jgi:hypothetical protein
MLSAGMEDASFVAVLTFATIALTNGVEDPWNEDSSHSIDYYHFLICVPDGDRGRI